jgi:uncharacterized protein
MNSSFFLNNLINPSILFFILGFILQATNSKFSFSKGLSQFLTTYLLIAVGFKGGVSVINSSESGLELMRTSLFGIFLSLFLPVIAYQMLKKSALDSDTKAAVAAHYGSVSLVTFVTATAFLTTEGIPFAGYTVAILALMESPAILSGLILAHKQNSSEKSSLKMIKTILHEIKADGVLIVLLGSFIIGLFTGNSGLEKLSGFLVTPFNGILTLFLFDMGLKVGKQAHNLKLFNVSLISFALYMPLIGASLALIFCKIFGVNLGTTTLLMVLGGSASYIAVPAVMQVSLPNAKAAVYLPMSLAITFPFNIVIGIPIYYKIAQVFL